MSSAIRPKKAYTRFTVVAPWFWAYQGAKLSSASAPISGVDKSNQSNPHENQPAGSNELDLIIRLVGLNSERSLAEGQGMIHPYEPHFAE